MSVKGAEHPLPLDLGLSFSPTSKFRSFPLWIVSILSGRMLTEHTRMSMEINRRGIEMQELGQNVIVESKGSKIVITVDADAPGWTSKSGKSENVGSTLGNRKFVHNGIEYTIGMTVYTAIGARAAKKVKKAA